MSFHDGTPFDAAAVKFNIERMMDKATNTTNRPLWDPIAGADVVDEYTVVIRTSAPFAQLPNTLAHGSGAIVSPAAIEKSGEKGIAQNPVGAGPYMMDTFNAGPGVEAEGFRRLLGRQAGADRLVFRFIPEPATRISALRTGAVDVIDAVPVQLVSARGDPNIEVVRRPACARSALPSTSSRLPYDEAGAPGAQPRRSGRDDRRARLLRLRQGTGLAARLRTHGHKTRRPTCLGSEGEGAAGRGRLQAGRRRAARGDGKPLKLTLLASEGLFPGDVAVAEIARPRSGRSAST